MPRALWTPNALIRAVLAMKLPASPVSSARAVATHTIAGIDVLPLSYRRVVGVAHV